MLTYTEKILNLKKFFDNNLNTREKLSLFIAKMSCGDDFPEIVNTIKYKISLDFPTEEIDFVEFCKKIFGTRFNDFNAELYFRNLIALYSDDSITSYSDLKNLFVKNNVMFNEDKLILFYKMMFELPYMQDSQLYFKKLEDDFVTELQTFLNQ